MCSDRRRLRVCKRTRERDRPVAPLYLRKEGNRGSVASAISHGTICHGSIVRMYIAAYIQYLMVYAEYIYTLYVDERFRVGSGLISISPIEMCYTIVAITLCW